MKTLEELKLELIALERQIEQFNKADVHYITQDGAVLTMDYIPNWVYDETLIYPCEKWTREEVERIALACKLLRKRYICAKENNQIHEGLMQARYIEENLADIDLMAELTKKIDKELSK